MVKVVESAAGNNGSERSRRTLGFVGLACLLLALYTMLAILYPLRWSLVAFWATIEVIFYVFYFRPRYAELDAQPKQHRPANENAMTAFNRMLKYFKETKSDINYEMYYSGWFMGAKFEDIKRGNAEEFLAYAFWYRTLQEMQDDGLEHVPAEMLDKLENTWGLVLQPGYTPGLQFMGHLWEPLKAQWRPLAFYLSTAAAGWFATAMLKRWGFLQASHEGMVYFTLNMFSGGQLTANNVLEPIQDGSSANLSDMSTATSVVSPGSAATPPAARECAASAPAFCAVPAMPAAPANTPEVSSLSSCEMSMPRSKSSSPFVRQGLCWSDTVAKYEDHLAASISVASAVHTPEPALPPPGIIRRSGSNARRRFGPPPVTHHPVLTPRLSAHTSMLLKATLNPLEEVLSEDMANNEMPVLFLHGVGGLPAYLEMLLQVMALGHPVIVVQCPGVAMRLGQVLPADQVVEQVIGVLDKLGVEQACVIGHSYGTFIAGRLARLHSNRVRSLCLIDPVCFGMFMPQLLCNFLYSVPPWRGLHHIVDYIKKGGVYMASHELHVCATFSRSFFWTDLNLWPEDLAPGSVVLLSGCDDLMNAQQVKAMLEQFDHIKVHYNHDLTHGEFLIKSEVKQAVIEEVRTMLRRGGSAVVGLARPVLNTTMTLARNALGVGGVVRMHTAGDGAKYVEDHTNKLVRTFTGNLTAMLHQVHSLRSNVKLNSSGSGSAGGSSSVRSRLSMMAGSSSTMSPTSSAGDSVNDEQQQQSASRLSQASAPQSLLAQSMSVPLKAPPAQQLWLKKVAAVHSAIAEQASGASTAIESTGSNNSDQLQPAAEGELCTKTTADDADAGEELLGGKLRGALVAKIVARRSSGSGVKVVGLGDGLEVVACGTPVLNQERI